VNTQSTQTVGITTSSGLAFWLFLCVALLFLFHFVGFRAIFTAGRSAAA